MNEGIELLKLAANLALVPLVSVLWSLSSRVATLEAKIDMMLERGTK